MSSPLENGIVTIPGSQPVDETVETLRRLLAQKGVTLFAIVDHSGEAAKAGLTLPPTKLLIFGNPKAGTPAMLASPTSAIDLPLKILVWQNQQGETQLTYNTAEYLAHRHNIPAELTAALNAAAQFASAAAANATT